MLTQTEIDTLVARIATRVSPQQVIVFGSYAKGTATADSDLDILVIADTDVPIARRADRLIPPLSPSIVRVDVHVYTPDEVRAHRRDPLSFISSVLRTGKTVFEAPAGAGLEADQPIVPDNIKAAGAIYYGAMLEEMRLFDVVDRIVEMYSSGQLSLGGAESGDLLYDYIKGAPNRMTEAERRTLYTRALGLPGGGSAATPNREFQELWLRFVTSVADLAAPRARAPVLRADGSEVDQDHVRRAARELAANISAHAYGLAAAAARLRKEIDARWTLLSSADLQQAFATRGARQLVEHVAVRDLGGAPPGHAYAKARAGAVVFAWLATRAPQLSDGSIAVLDPAVIQTHHRAPDPTTHPTDRDLVNACEQWLAVAAISDERVETYSQPKPSPAVEVVADLPSPVIDLVAGFLHGTASFDRLPPPRQAQIFRDTTAVVAYLAGNPAAGRFDALVQSVDFPAFVAGIINGVFNAIVNASIEQMEAYGDLIHNVAGSLDEFRDSALTDEEAADHLAVRVPALPCAREALEHLLVVGDLHGRGAPPQTRRQQLLATMVLMGVNRVVRQC